MLNGFMAFLKQTNTCLTYSGHSTPHITYRQPQAHLFAAICWPLQLDLVAPRNLPRLSPCPVQWLSADQSWVNALSLESGPSHFPTRTLCTALNDIDEWGCCVCFLMLCNQPGLFDQTHSLLLIGNKLWYFPGNEDQAGFPGESHPPFDIQVWSWRHLVGAFKD